MKRFLKQLDGINYYLVDEGMGGYLNPPGHPEHTYSIQGFRGGHEVRGISLREALDDEYAGSIRGAAKNLLNKWSKGRPAAPPEEWVKQVYIYFQHCYSKNGTNRSETDCITYGKFWGNAEQEKDANPYFHLGFLFVNEFFPAHGPRLDLIGVQ